jgi:hypothetical protein
MSIKLGIEKWKSQDKNETKVKVSLSEIMAAVIFNLDNKYTLVCLDRKYQNEKVWSEVKSNHVVKPGEHKDQGY